MPTTLVVVVFFFVVLPACFAGFAALVLLYLWNLFELLERLERDYPALWNELGRPRRGTMQTPGPGGVWGGSTHYTITPFAPLFRWVLDGGFEGVDGEALAMARRARRSLFAAVPALVVLLALFFVFVAVAESGA